jgi:hypothetical protein
VEYNYQGSRCSTTVGGDSWSEAEQHLKSIGANGRIVGSNAIRIPVNLLTLPFAHAFAVVWTWMRNAFR